MMRINLTTMKNFQNSSKVLGLNDWHSKVTNRLTAFEVMFTQSLALPAQQLDIHGVCKLTMEYM